MENTIHLPKTQYIYRKHNTFMDNKIHLPKTQYIYRKQDTFMENTTHLPKTQYIYRKHYTLIENKIHLSETQYIYRKHNKFFEKHNTLVEIITRACIGLFKIRKQHSSEPGEERLYSYPTEWNQCQPLSLHNWTSPFLTSSLSSLHTARVITLLLFIYPSFFL